MKHLKKKLGLLIATCLFVAGYAFAGEDKEDEASVVCELFPSYCLVEPAGNGGGHEPPPKDEES